MKNAAIWAAPMLLPDMLFQKNLHLSLENVRDVKFPEDLPILHEIMDLWESLHRKVTTETDRSEVIRLDGGYYLHFEKQQEIVEKVNEWILN